MNLMTKYHRHSEVAMMIGKPGSLPRSKTEIDLSSNRVVLPKTKYVIKPTKVQIQAQAQSPAAYKSLVHPHFCHQTYCNFIVLPRSAWESFTPIKTKCKSYNIIKYYIF